MLFADSIYYCSNYTGRIGTQEMNEDIYDKAKEGGMTKQEFHAVYTQFDGTRCRRRYGFCDCQL